jgi:hypothetical protein
MLNYLTKQEEQVIGDETPAKSQQSLEINQFA